MVPAFKETPTGAQLTAAPGIRQVLGRSCIPAREEASPRAVSRRMVSADKEEDDFPSRSKSTHSPRAVSHLLVALSEAGE